ncbi:MAG TPA: hypothetical protein VMH39_12310 [Gemmatimonadaceae bacterium]|nr:hypothetical protein [Gemmatimonadaceae bacterium]
MKGAAAFLGATAALLVVVGVVLGYPFHGPRDALAIRVSGVIVLVVQLGAFLIVRRMGARNVMAGAGLSAIIRMGTIIAYAVLIGTVIAVPATAALLSMAIFFLLSSLIEPLFLRI